MDPDRTTTIGDDEAVNTDRPFHIINAVERTSAKLRICASVWRGFDMLVPRDDNMMGELVRKAHSRDSIGGGRFGGSAEHRNWGAVAIIGYSILKKMKNVLV